MDKRKHKRRRHGALDINVSTILITVHKKKDFAVSSMNSLNQLRKSGILCDVQLIAESASDQSEEHLDGVTRKEEIPAHRCVLASRSDYFKAMFTIGMSESKQNVINIHDVSHHILTKVVEFLYNGSCRISEDEIYDLTNAAVMLQIPSMLEACKEYLITILDIRNFFQLYSLANVYHLTDILERCQEIISNHLGELIKQEAFNKLPASMIHRILKLPKVNLGLNQDHKVLQEALQNWVMSSNKDEIDQLKEYIELKKLGVTLPPGSDEGACMDNSDRSDQITTLPGCFSLIVVMGGFLQSRTIAQRPTANTIEVFNTSSLTWQSSSPISTKARPILFRTVFKSNGMFYFLSKDKYDVILYQYQPIRSQWNKIRKLDSGEALQRLVDSISCVRAAADDEHELYFCGSVTVSSADNGKVAFKINVEKNTVEELPPLPSPRYHHGAVVAEGDLYVIGGSSLTWGPQKSVLRLRKGHPNWEEVSCMLTPRVGPGVAVLGGFIYAAGGTSSIRRLNTVERYNIATDTWEMVPQMKYSRAFPGAVAAGGCLFVFGGKSYVGPNENSGARHVLRSCEKFDPLWNNWLELPDMEKCRCEMVTLTV